MAGFNLPTISPLRSIGVEEQFYAAWLYANNHSANRMVNVITTPLLAWVSFRYFESKFFLKKEERYNEVLSTNKEEDRQLKKEYKRNRFLTRFQPANAERLKDCFQISNFL